MTDPVIDRWEQSEDWFMGEDTRAGSDLTTTEVSVDPGEWCWRVRYRDQALSWSAWSAPTAFEVTGGG